MSSFPTAVDKILSRQNFAVVGASRNPDKFGKQVFHTLKRAGYITFPVNPNIGALDGDQVYPQLSSIPSPIDCVVCVVPPAVTLEAVRAAARMRVPYIWMQPGAESETAVQEAISLGMEVVHGGPCIMVEIAIRRD